MSGALHRSHGKKGLTLIENLKNCLTFSFWQNHDTDFQHHCKCISIWTINKCQCSRDEWSLQVQKYWIVKLEWITPPPDSWCFVNHISIRDNDNTFVTTVTIELCGLWTGRWHWGGKIKILFSRMNHERCITRKIKIYHQRSYVKGELWCPRVVPGGITVWSPSRRRR